jgi:uncharacterized protein (TIGR02466 family)
VSSRTKPWRSIIAQQEAREADNTARFRDQNFFRSENRAVRWLKDQIDQTAAGFLRHVGVHWPVFWTYTGWYNVNRYGDHHGPHNHPRCTMSGTYYVRVPSDQERVEDPLARPACISFYDPRTGANMVTVGTESDARSAYVVSPTAGTLLMWPRRCSIPCTRTSRGSIASASASTCKCIQATDQCGR